MDKFENYIDRVIQKVLTEAAEEKASEVSEKLHGKQKNIDKNKNGKIDAEDFKLLRKKETKEQEEFDGELDVDFDEFDPRDKSWEEIKAHTGAPDYSEIDEQDYIDPKDGELDEFYFYDDESTPGDYEGDEEEEEEAEELSAQEPTYVGRGLADNKPGKMFGSFSDDHGWYDESDRQFGGKFDFDYDEEEFDEFEPFMEKYGDKQKWFAPGEGKRFFNAYKEKMGGPFRVRTRRMMEGDDAETQDRPGKMFGSFSDDHGWYDESDRQFGGKFDFDYDEEEFDEFDPFMEKYGDKQKWFAPGDGKRYFNAYKEKMGGPFRVRTRKMMEGDDAETQEGNAFTGALAKTKKGEKFKLGDKTYTDTSNLDESDKKWIQKTDMKKGALHKKLGVPEGSKIPKSKLNSLKKELMAKAKGDKKLSAADSKTLKQVNMALTLGKLKETKTNTLKLTENELIDLIEKIVIEQKSEKPKGNIAPKTPKGLEVAEKVHREDGKENKDALEDVAKKMRDYLKDGSKGKFEMNPKHFPKGNGELAKMEKKAYSPDADAEEYIEEFSYGGGMENLDYDEIKPNEEWMENTLVGSSKTGNSQKYANAVETELGEKINKKRKRNMFSQEKKNSYKRVDQPTSGSNKSKEQKDSDKLFAKLESTEDKSNKLVVEQLEKMKHLFTYNQKTQ